MQHDESTSRQIDAHQPPASHHRHGLDSPAPTTPKAGTQAQHIAGQHQRTAEERQHPRERTEGVSSTKAQGRHPGGRGSKAREKQAASACTQSQPRRTRPAGGQRTASTTQGTAPARQEEGERGERRERERGTARKRQYKSAAQLAPPIQPAPRRSGYTASNPSIHGQRTAQESARGQENQFRFCGVCRTALDQRRPRYPRRSKARGILYILNDQAPAKIPPCTPFSTPLNFSPTQNPYITPLVIVLIFGFMIFRLRTRFLHVDHRTFLWISDFQAFILTGGFGKEIAVDYRTESLSYPYK